MELTPIYDAETEQAAIGGIMRDAVSAIPTFVQMGGNPEWFFVPSHKEIIKVVLELWKSSRMIDALTVSQRMNQVKGLNREGDFLVTLNQYMDTCVVDGHINYYFGLVQDMYLRRKVQHELMSSADGLTTELNVTSIVCNLMSSVDKIIFSQHQGVSTEDAIKNALHEHKEAAENKNIVNTQSPWSPYNDHTAGFPKKKYTVWAARPGDGKSAMACKAARLIAAQDKKKVVGYISLEMTTQELVSRMACSTALVDGFKLIRGTATKAERELWQEHAEKVLELPLFITDFPMNIHQIRGWVQKMKAKEGLDLVFIDYIQRIVTDGSVHKKRHEIVGEISNILANTAKELDVHIVALSQINRSGAADRGKKVVPTLANLKDSGALEEDADVVALFYPDPDRTGQANEPVPMVANIAKCRHGKTGKYNWLFDKAHQHIICTDNQETFDDDAGF